MSGGPRRASEAARAFARAAGGGATPPAAAPARVGPSSSPPGPAGATSKYTLLLEPEMAALFDELALRLRRRMRRPVQKAAILRALILLVADDPTLVDQLAAELA